MLSFSQYLEEKIKLTLKYHDKLNAKLWKKDQLDPKVVDLLLDKAYDFAKFSNVDKSRIKDIVITGGNVNYNYTKFSDIDVHLMCDTSGLDSDELFEKKKEYSKKIADTKVAGYPLEFFAASNEEHYPKGQGVYSLLHNKWLIVPKHLDHVDTLSDPKTQDKIEHAIKYIKWLLKDGTLEEIEEYREKLHTGRAAGLHDAGEFSIENVMYKDLRNRGLLDKLKDRSKILSKQG